MGNKVKAILNIRQILLLAALGFAQCSIFTFPYMQYTFYKPLQNALHASNEQLGFLMTLYGICEVVSFLFGGWIADRFPVRKIITFSLLATGILSVIASFVTVYPVYCAIWIILGVVDNLAFWSASMKAVRMIGNAEEQGKTYGYFYLFNTGLGTATQAVGLLIVKAVGETTILGFRFALFFFAAMAVVSAIIIWISLGRTNQLPIVMKQEDKITAKDYLAVLKRKECWMIALVSFSLYSLTTVATYFTPYFSDVMHLSVVSAGLIYVITGPFQALFGPIMGTISDYMRSTVKTIMIFLGVILVTLTIILVLNGKLAFSGAVAIDAVFTIISAGIYNIMFSMVEETGMDRKVAGTCIGAASMIAYMPDVFLFTMFGNWLDKYKNGGYAMIFKYGWVLAAFALVISIFLYVSIKRRRKSGLQESSTSSEGVFSTELNG